MFSMSKWMSVLKSLKTRVVVVLAGDLDLDLHYHISKQDIVIAIDGGYNHLLAANLKPNVVIGDLDSIAGKPDCKVISFDPVKDETDFKCGLNYIAENYNSLPIVVFGFSSMSRIDHLIANLANIQCNATYMSANHMVQLLQADTVITADQYKYYSFFSFEIIDRFSLSGFKYPLVDYQLKPFDPLCVSNELIEEIGDISISNGQVLMIKSKFN